MQCALPLASCLCHLVRRCENEVDVLVLQHPSERREAKGSLRLLARSLARCTVVVGEVFEPAALEALLHGEGRRSALLYPAGERAAEAACGPGEAPTQLVVLDGTWRKSLRMLMSNPGLQRLPRHALAPTAPGVYRALRKAPRPGQLSTLEATCAALAELEQAPARYASLLADFGRFVDERVARMPPP
jgi:DTW domain-containing protein YfiP